MSPPTGRPARCAGTSPTDGLRLTWLPPDDDQEITIQLTVQPVATGTALSSLQERMRDVDEREQRLVHWTGVVERLMRDLDARSERN